MAKLPIGTKVEVTNYKDKYFAQQGTIIAYLEFQDYEVEFWGGRTEYYVSSELTEHIPKKQRGFVALPGYEDITMPTRSSKGSAAYDLRIPCDFVLIPGESRLFNTGLAAYMQDDEMLQLFIRSSVGIKANVELATSVSVIDSDYIHSDNGGHIKIALRNNGDKVFSNVKEVAVAQGIFSKYLLCDDDDCTTIRNGGIGSSTK